MSSMIQMDLFSFAAQQAVETIKEQPKVAAPAMAVDESNEVWFSARHETFIKALTGLLLTILLKVNR